MKTCLSLTLLAFVLLFSHGTAQDDKKLQETLENLVFGKMVAGFEWHDWEKYHTLWEPGAKITGGRREADGKYRISFDWKQFIKTRELMFADGKLAEKMKFALKYKTVKFTGKKDGVYLETTNRIMTGETLFIKVRENFRLRQIKGEWKVTENEWWPVSMLVDGKQQEYSGDAADAIDQKVEDALQAGDNKKLRTALFNAWRMKELYELCKTMTEAKDATADDWTHRANAAMYLGMGDDCLESFRMTIILDPESELPKPITAYLQNKLESCQGLISSFVQKIQLYRLKYKAYPPSGNKRLTVTLKEGGWLEQEGDALLDPWGSPFSYSLTSPENIEGEDPRPYYFYSFGANRKDEKGRGDDITSWPQSPRKE